MEGLIVSQLRCTDSYANDLSETVIGPFENDFITHISWRSKRMKKPLMTSDRSLAPPHTNGHPSNPPHRQEARNWQSQNRQDTVEQEEIQNVVKDILQSKREMVFCLPASRLENLSEADNLSYSRMKHLLAI